MTLPDPLTAPAAAIPTRTDRGGPTLLDCARVFFRFPSPKILALALAAALATRLISGPWSWLDLVVAGLLIAFQPFSEWLIHVGFLHSKPRRLGPFTIDLPTARLHRHHHRHPTLLETVLIPWYGIVAILALIAGTMWLLTWPWVLAGGDHTTLFLSATLCGYALLDELRVVSLHHPYPIPSEDPLLPVDLEVTPPSPFQERALLVRGQLRRRGSSAGHLSGSSVGSKVSHRSQSGTGQP